MIKIGRLPAGRWADYRRLRLEGLKNDPTAFGSSYEEEAIYPEAVWRERIGNCIFAMAGGVPVGVVSVVFSDRKKTRHVADIYGFYVTPPHRRKGVGSALMGEALRVARSKGSIRKLKLSVNPRLEASVAVYRKSGFQETGRERGQIRVGRKYYDLIDMELMLA